MLRGLRALLQDARPTPELEKAVQDEIEHALPTFETAAVTTTFPRNQIPDWCEPLVRVDENTPTPIALTLFAATVGTAIEETLADALSRGEDLRSRVLSSLGEEAAEQAATFVERLMTEEARRDACEISDRHTLPQESMRALLLEHVDAARVMITLDSAGHLSPRFTRLGFILWWPLSKKKK